MYTLHVAVRQALHILYRQYANIGFSDPDHTYMNILVPGSISVNINYINVVGI